MKPDAGRLRLVALALLALPSLVACQQPVESVEKPARLVRAMNAVPQDHARTAVLTGEVQARTKSDLAFRLTGQVTEIEVEVGDHVIAGQILAKIDAESQEADVALAEASVRAAQAGLQQAVAVLARQQTLLDKGLVTRSKFDQAEQDRRTAASSLESAQALRQAALNALSYTEIRANADGVVTAVNRDVGEIAQSAQPVVSIAHDGPRDAVFNVYEPLLLSISDDLPTAQVDIAPVTNGTVHVIGRIREISPTVDPRTGTVRITVSLSEAPSSIMLGALVTGRVTMPAEPAFILPWTSLTTDQDKPAVWLVDNETRTARIRHVEVQEYTTHGVVLAKGLNRGELVVTEGGQFLYEGKPVMAVVGEKP